MISHLFSSWQLTTKSKFSKQLLLANSQSNNIVETRYSHMFFSALDVDGLLLLIKWRSLSFYLQQFAFSFPIIWQSQTCSSLLCPSFIPSRFTSIAFFVSHTELNISSVPFMQHRGEIFLSEPLMCIIMQSVPTGSGKSADLLWKERRGFKIPSQDSRTIHYHCQGAAGRKGGVGCTGGL